MKIKRNRLVEAEEDIINPQEETTGEIADKVEAEVETATNDKVEVAPEEAADIAAEIKDAGETLNAKAAVIAPAEDSPLEIKNRLTDALDAALEASKYFKKENISEVANVLVSGLPGSSKTASVYNWAKARGINITYLNAKNNDLDAFINGYTVQDPEDKLSVTQAISRNLDGLDRPNSVLFLDEYNRQTKPQIRASLLTLINEHYVVGREDGGRHYFKNFLFTIAAINPAIGMEDEGAAPLNDAEKSRYLFKVKNFDSDPLVTADYIRANYDNKIKKILAENDPKDPEVLDRIERLLRIQNLGIFIVSHEDFTYDDQKKLSALYNKDRTMLNQRTLTAGLAASGGQARNFRIWVDNGSDFLDEDVEMLDGILDEYKEPTREELFAKANISTGAETATDNSAKEVAAEEEQEDDADFFTNSSASSTAGSKVATATEIDDKIRKVIASW